MATGRTAAEKLERKNKYRLLMKEKYLGPKFQRKVDELNATGHITLAYNEDGQTGIITRVHVINKYGVMEYGPGQYGVSIVAQFPQGKPFKSIPLARYAEQVGAFQLDNSVRYEAGTNIISIPADQTKFVNFPEARAIIIPSPTDHPFFQATAGLNDEQFVSTTNTNFAVRDVEVCLETGRLFYRHAHDRVYYYGL